MTSMVNAAVAPRRSRSLVSRIWAAYELGKTRTQLRSLPDHLLADIGISRSEAQAEACRPAWDVPGWWRG